MLTSHRWFLKDVGSFFNLPDANGIRQDPASHLMDTWEQRCKYWEGCIDKEPWVVVWWICHCIGKVINVGWVYQSRLETDPRLIAIKTGLQENWKRRLIRLLDAIYLNLIDHDVNSKKAWLFHLNNVTGNQNVSSYL